VSRIDGTRATRWIEQGLCHERGIRAQQVFPNPKPSVTRERHLTRCWNSPNGFSKVTLTQQARRCWNYFNGEKKRRTRLHWFTRLPPEPDGAGGGL